VWVVDWRSEVTLMDVSRTFRGGYVSYYPFPVDLVVGMGHRYGSIMVLFPFGICSLKLVPAKAFLRYPGYLE